MGPAQRSANCCARNSWPTSPVIAMSANCCTSADHWQVIPHCCPVSATRPSNLEDMSTILHFHAGKWRKTRTSKNHRPQHWPSLPKKYAVFRQEATQEAAARAWSAAISAALSLPSRNRTCPEQRELQGKLRGLFRQWLVAASAWLGCHSASDWTLWRSHLYTSGISACQFFQLFFECSSLPSIQGTPQVVRAPVTPKSQGPDRGDCMNLWCAAKTIMYVMWLYLDPIQYMPSKFRNERIPHV